ncbi:MAG: tetratricopeptide repeat protein [Geobacteraceae bacterium]|nr:tetratricopeptide repeat protein [Geobacteraceae bacterium]
MNEPSTPGLIETAESHLRTGNLEKAERICSAILDKAPDNVEALFLLGNIVHQKGLHQDAVSCFKRALREAPGIPVLHLNLGTSLWMLKRYEESITELKKATVLDPAYSTAWFQLGVVLEDKGDLGPALDAYTKTRQLAPDHDQAVQRSADIKQRQNRLEEALELYQEALRLQPLNFMACNNAGNAAKCLGKISEALDWYQKALDLEPSHRICASNYLMCMLLSDVCTPVEIFRKHALWSGTFEAPLAPSRKPLLNIAAPERPLRIGYLSCDFKNHPVAFFIEPILASHNRHEVTVFCYSNCDSPDMITAQLEKLANVWRPIHHLGDEQVSDLIRTDGIDILVDLGGHTARNRLTVFARKPAPVQVSWLGYAATTGLKSIDYRITDAAADPRGLTERFHSETLCRLPGNFICYRPPANSPPVAPLPCLTNGFVTFGVFNHFAKITPKAVALWCSILRTLPDAKLLIKALGMEHEPMRKKAMEMFASQGIAPQRLELVGKTPSIYSHLELFGKVDISLDTFPYNGTTTTCESLWMGVPVIAKEGDSHVSRVSVSLLGAVGLSGLVAATDEDYVALAAFLARDWKNLEILRNNLRDRMRGSKLLDTVGFTRNLEGAYREMWRRWCAERNGQK